MEKKKRLIVDIDNTVTVTENGDYVHSKAVQATIDMLKKYKEQGFEIVMFSSRNMRTYEANVGKINIHPSRGIFYVQIGGNRKTKIIFDLMYDKSTIYLQRKFDIYDNHFYK